MKVYIEVLLHYALAVDRESQWLLSVIKMIIPGSIVILHLQNPREKVWGAMLAINHFGITLRGIDVYSFDDWARSVANQGEVSIGLSTIFVPTLRVEKLVLDETSGSYKSLSDQFKGTCWTRCFRVYGFA